MCVISPQEKFTIHYSTKGHNSACKIVQRFYDPDLESRYLDIIHDPIIINQIHDCWHIGFSLISLHMMYNKYITNRQNRTEIVLDSNIILYSNTLPACSDEAIHYMYTSHIYDHVMNSTVTILGSKNINIHQTYRR